jgi:hypothetical protein
VHEARNPEDATYMENFGTSRHAGKHLETFMEEADGGSDCARKFLRDVGASRSIEPFKQAVFNSMLGEFEITDITAAVTSRSKFPCIDTAVALSAENTTEPITNKSAPTPRASGSATLFCLILTWCKVIALELEECEPLLVSKPYS